MNDIKRAAPFGIRDKIGYLLGDLGNDFTFLLSSTFLLKFYTDVMQINAGIVGIVMMLARFIDAFTDVTMGRLCDRVRPGQNGKFRPWILRMCLPVALSSFLIYQSGFASSPTWFKVTWLTLTYVLWGSVFYTSINIPYGSMASTISREPRDRQSLSTYRTMGSTLAGVIVGAGIPLFAYNVRIIDGIEIAELDGRRFTLIAGIFSALAVLCYLLCYRMTTERVVPNEAVRDRGGVKNMILSSLKNRALVSIIAASVLMLLSQLTMQQMANYVFPDYYASTAAQSASTIAMMLGMIVAATVAKPLSQRFGKAEISVFSSLLAAAVCILLFFLRPQNVWVYVGVSLVSWLGLGVFAMVSWALITDVIDYSEIKNGIREDGSIYALYSFSRKIGQAAAAGLAGFFLSAIGYEKIDGAALPDNVREGIFNLSTLLPAVGFILLSAVLWFWYPLNKKEVDKNVKILKEKHEKAG